MVEMDQAFFEKAKDDLIHSKIEYLNMAGVQLELAEERHVIGRLPVADTHMNHVGIVYAGSYFVFAEAIGASLIKCSYGGRFVPMIKNVSIDYISPSKEDLIIDLSMSPEQALEKIAYVEENGRGRYPLDIPVMTLSGKPCAQVHIVYYLIKKQEE